MISEKWSPKWDVPGKRSKYGLRPPNCPSGGTPYPLLTACQFSPSFTSRLRSMVRSNLPRRSTLLQQVRPQTYFFKEPFFCPIHIQLLELFVGTAITTFLSSRLPTCLHRVAVFVYLQISCFVYIMNFYRLIYLVCLLSNWYNFPYLEALFCLQLISFKRSGWVFF